MPKWFAHPPKGTRTRTVHPMASHAKPDISISLIVFSVESTFFSHQTVLTSEKFHGPFLDRKLYPQSRVKERMNSAVSLQV